MSKGEHRRHWLGRVLPLAVIIAVTHVLHPVIWAPLDDRLYDYFHSKRVVEPWTDVVVIGIDRETRDHLLDRPVFPLSRHTDQHAALVRALGAAGARAVVFDLELGSDLFSTPPTAFAEAIREVGSVYLIASLREEYLSARAGVTTVVLRAALPDSALLRASRGAFVVDVEVDRDGVLRRFGPDPRLEDLGLRSLPESLSGVAVDRRVPIEFPSLEQPIPALSYAEVLRRPEGITSAVTGRIAFVGLVEAPWSDFVDVPRAQAVGGGATTPGLPGVVALAAITETLLRGGPIRDASWPQALAWSVLWAGLCLTVIPGRRPVTAVLLFLGIAAASLAATGLLHARGDVVMPAWLLIGSVILAGAYAFVASYIGATKDLQAEEAENERMRRELEVARETQERFLPGTLPTLSGADVWGTNRSCLEVSGDYFDVLLLGPDGPLLLVIADVSGKGLPAALLMSTVQAGLHMRTYETPFDLDAATRGLNRLVCSNSEAGVFVTFFAIEFDPVTGSLRYARAGHDPAIVVSPDGATRRLEDGGLVLGFVEDAGIEVALAGLDEGDVLCLYTDGITEARSPDGREFGIEGIEAVVAKHVTRSAREIGESVLKAVETFTAQERQADDVTIVVLRVVPR